MEGPCESKVFHKIKGENIMDTEEKAICKNCGQPFERKSGNQDFCSKECRSIKNNQQARERRANEKSKDNKKKNSFSSYTEYCEKNGYVSYGAWQMLKMGVNGN